MLEPLLLAGNHVGFHGIALAFGFTVVVGAYALGLVAEVIAVMSHNHGGRPNKLLAQSAPDSPPPASQLRGACVIGIEKTTTLP